MSQERVHYEVDIDQGTIDFVLAKSKQLNCNHAEIIEAAIIELASHDNGAISRKVNLYRMHTMIDSNYSKEITDKYSEIVTSIENAIADIYGQAVDEMKSIIEEIDNERTNDPEGVDRASDTR